MFLRRVVARGHTYLRIVRSVRENGKKKQEVLFTLGRLDALQASGELDGLLRALNRLARRQEWINLAEDLSIEQVYHLGAAHVVRRMLERVGLWKALEKVAHAHRRMEMPWLPLVFGMILARFIEPCSKRRLQQEWWGKVYPELLGVPEPPLHWFYRAMDLLYRHREEVERALFDRNGERDLFNQTLDVVFYDTTTLYFESTNDEDGDLRRFGRGKEHRSDCVQVVLGLLVDKDGIPVGYELFPGNTYDGKSVPKVVEKLQRKYAIGRVIFVGDRGMVSRDNIAEIRGAGLDFILGMRLWKMPAEATAGFYDMSRYREVGTRGKFFIREVEYEDDRLVLTWSEERAKRDARTRDELLKKLEKRLSENPTPRQLVTNRGFRQFVKGLEEGRAELNAQAIEASRKRDGFYGVLTNVAKEKMTDQEVYGRYKELWRIEDSFGEIKGPLRTRPMFHWTDPRIHAHVLLCVVAYFVEAVMTRRIREVGVAFTVGELFRALNEVYAVPVTVRGSRAWVRNELKGVAAEGYEVLRIRPPDRVLKLEKVEPAASPSPTSAISQKMPAESPPEATP